MALFKPKAETADKVAATCIGSKTRFEGEIFSRNNLEIAGSIKGDIKTEGCVTLDAAARVEGHIECTEFRHAGRAEGTLRVSSLAAFLPGSSWEGELFPRRLDIQPGALVQGKIVPFRA